MGALFLFARCVLMPFSPRESRVTLSQHGGVFKRAFTRSYFGVHGAETIFA